MKKIFCFNYLLIILFFVSIGYVIFQYSIIRAMENTLCFCVDDTLMEYKKSHTLQTTLNRLKYLPNFESNRILNDLIITGAVDSNEDFNLVTMISKNSEIKNNILIETGWRKYNNIIIPYKDGKFLLEVKSNRIKQDFIICDYNNNAIKPPHGSGCIFYDFIYISPKASVHDKFRISKNSYLSDDSIPPSHIVVGHLWIRGDIFVNAL